MDKNEQQEQVGIRLDKWLWAARFFKTRALAAQAISGGKVHLNGTRTKAARLLQVGDKLEIQRIDGRHDIEVMALSAHRGPASSAQKLYRESDASVAARAAQAELRRLVPIQHDAGRPEKRTRQILRKLRGRD